MVFEVDTNSSSSPAEQRGYYRGAGRSRAGHLAMILRNFNKTTGAYEGVITTNNVVDLQSIGAQANTAGSGIAISATATGALRVFSDDAGAAIAESVRGAQSRFLVTYNQAGGTIRALQGQLKILTGKTVGTGIYTAVQGYAELVGTLGVNSGATFSCFDASLELGGVMTVASGGEAFGIHVETTGAGTIVNNGTCAAVGITKASGAASWPVGLLIGASTATIGISMGACTTGIALTGAVTTGISISGNATDGIKISGGTVTDAIEIGACTTGLNISGATTNAIAISGTSSNSSLWISGAGTSGYNEGSILIAADQAGAALAYGANTTGAQVIRIIASAQITGGENFQGIYSTLSTAGAMADGYIIGHYSRVQIAHQAYENYAIWGRMDVNVAQTGDVGNQYIGVLGSVGFAAGAHALTDTGGGYGVQGIASIASGGTLDQPLLGGYFECNAVDNIAGLTCASRHRMLGYCDYGVDVLCQTSNGTAGVRINTTDSAVLPTGLAFIVTSGSITNAFAFPAEGTAPVVTTGWSSSGAHGGTVVKVACTVGGQPYFLLASTAPTGS